MKKSQTANDPTFDRVYHWRNNPSRLRLKGQRCRIIEMGSSMCSALVEFEDGERIVTSVRALRKS